VPPSVENERPRFCCGNLTNLSYFPERLR
jgi:hypothetical protein